MWGPFPHIPAPLSRRRNPNLVSEPNQSRKVGHVSDSQPTIGGCFDTNTYFVQMMTAPHTALACESVPVNFSGTCDALG